MTAHPPQSRAREAYLTPRQAADLLGVCSRTVTRWADLGHLPYIMTLGGHRRFREADVLALRRHG